MITVLVADVVVVAVVVVVVVVAADFVLLLRLFLLLHYHPFLHHSYCKAVTEVLDGDLLQEVGFLLDSYLANPTQLGASKLLNSLHTLFRSFLMRLY